MKTCGKAQSYTRTLPIAFGTDNKRYTCNSLLGGDLVERTKDYNSIATSNVTGEVPPKRGDGRGFVVVEKRRVQIDTKNSNGVCMVKNKDYSAKGARSRTIGFCNGRSYLTKSGKDKSVTVQLPEERSKDFERLAAHWKVSLDNPKRIFYDLKGFLKSNAVWFAAFNKIRSNKRAKTAGPDGETIKVLNQKIILSVKKQVLEGTYK